MSKCLSLLSLFSEPCSGLGPIYATSASVMLLYVHMVTVRTAFFF